MKAVSIVNLSHI